MLRLRGFSSVPLAGLAVLLAGPAAAAPVRLLSPGPGDTLVAGSAAWIAWEPTAEFAALGAPAEEWEAFLSFDGGRRYTVRLTPHLDLRLRRFRFEVPAVASGAARLLLRFGDERREVGVALPQAFRLVVPRTVLPAGREWAAGPGEPARPGEAGVVLWLDGDRRGERLTWRAAWAPPAAAPLARPAAALPLGPAWVRPPSGRAALGAVALALASAPRAAATGLRGRARPARLLALLHRRNE